MSFPVPSTAAASSSELACVLCVLCVLLLCFTYVREPDLKAGFHFFYKSPSGEFQLGLVCVGISEGNLSRPPAQLESAVGPLLYPILQISFVLVSGETVKGTCVR